MDSIINKLFKITMTIVTIFFCYRAYHLCFLVENKDTQFVVKEITKRASCTNIQLLEASLYRKWKTLCPVRETINNFKCLKNNKKIYGTLCTYIVNPNEIQYYKHKLRE